MDVDFEKNSSEIEINPKRINYLLELFSINDEDFEKLFNYGKDKKLSRNLLKRVDIAKGKLRLSVLKRIDKFFNKGLIWYILDEKPVKTKDSSIFFRKNNINNKLNFESKKIIHEFEEKEKLINSLAEGINFNLERILNAYTTEDNPKEVAQDYSKKI